MSRKYGGDMSLVLAAAEFGLRARQLSAKIASSPELEALGLGQLLVDGGAIKREVWENEFVRIARMLGYPTRLDADLLVGTWSGDMVMTSTSR